MKKLMMTFVVLGTFLISFNLKLARAESPTIVYFYSPTCSICLSVHPYIEGLKDAGIEVIEYNIYEDENLKLLNNYKAAYLIPSEDERGTVPIVFVGNQSFNGPEVIERIEDGTIQGLSTEPLNDIPDEYVSDIKIEGFIGFVTIIASGLLDGFNPCAIAMLLLFISLLGFTSKKRVLILVSFTYISALFLSYLALGTVLFRFLYKIQDQINFVNQIVSWFIILLSLFLFLFNFYDFWVSRKEEYGKVKNQLPKGIQKFNKTIIKYFTKLLNEQENNRFALFIVLGLTFVLGVIISLTEFLCTGQIYLPIIIALVQFSESFQLSGVLYLILYNLMFVMPLIVISVLAIKSKSVMSTSNFIREHLHIIKLLNGILFLIIAVFYLFKVL